MLLDFLLKFQRAVIPSEESEFLTSKNKVDQFHADLQKKQVEVEKENSEVKLNPFEKLYIKLHNGPWFYVLSPFLMMFLRNEWNKIVNNDQDNEYERRRRLDDLD